ncbi:fungal-specific transcription factor domain-containing protein [Echria macrotheca]|uniref:Fungal-specific transcription factor domain-containing protein n=1 Tax=Echria macrotheca TaxID=438768 RepID=A0AAJ0BLT3_9PEZI|nr:fungal-specific transcription factor domain-containing protein [Echria macrotheca]
MSSTSSDESRSGSRGGAETNGPTKDATVAETEAKRPPRKRRRTVISCTECHRRKQKCDRNLPCTNCVSRGKQGACRYETGAPTAKAAHKRQQSSASIGGDTTPAADTSSIPSKVAHFGYSQTGASTLGFLKKIEDTSTGTKGGPNEEDPSPSLAGGLNTDDAAPGESFNTRERYKSLIRQLPARTYIDKLVDLYFANFNWQYYGLDRDVFDRQLAEWYRLPFNLLTTGGPQALSPDLRAFPAMLFQTIATALLVLPNAGPDATFDSLKYAGGMTFEDLAMDYSESGVAILSLLGKRQMSVTTVLTGFLRASFLKYVALVTESWHAIGTAIRDAQEIGLHRDSLDPKPKSDDPAAVLENQWEIQRRRRVWMILVGWDVHTGVVLGRPISINAGMAAPTLPIDAPIPRDRSREPVLPRGENDPPTPLTRAICAYHVMLPLREIVELEKEGPCPKDFGKVDALHRRMLEIEAKTPAFFRLDNPDTRFDDHPDCYWLPAVRATLPQLMSFNFMALHRPYIFTRPKSRTAALRASLNMLHAQRLHFQSLKPHQYKTFSLFFGTFDAIVLMASVYILFPKEHRDLVQNALQHFQWAVERFEAMSERNALARAALGVLQAIFVRLKKSLGISPQACRAMLSAPVPPVSCTGAGPAGGSRGVFPFSPSLEGEGEEDRSPFSHPTTTVASMTTTTTTTNDVLMDDLSPAQMSSSVDEVSGGRSSITTTSSGGTFSTTTPQSTTTTTKMDFFNQPTTTTTESTGSTTEFDWSLPSDFDWASLQPIYATSDLVYNDLARGFRDDGAGGVLLPSSAWGGLDGLGNGAAAAEGMVGLGEGPGGGGGLGGGGGGGGGTVPFQFEGDFGNDSVWSLLNHYTPF